MALGRIKRRKHTAKSVIHGDYYPAYGAGKRQLGVKVYVQRVTRGTPPRGSGKAAGAYEALACVRNANVVRGGCGEFSYARSPQSAVAKALKSLSGSIAKRGRKGR